MTHGAACPIRFPLRSHGTPIWRPSVRSFSSGWEGGLHWWTAKLGVAGCSGWGPSSKDFGNIRFTIHIYIYTYIHIYIYTYIDISYIDLHMTKWLFEPWLWASPPRCRHLPPRPGTAPGLLRLVLFEHV